MNKNLPIAGWHTRAERRNRAVAIRMQKTDLKVDFQAVVRNAMHAMYAHKKCRKTQCTQSRINACVVFFACIRCVFWFLIASQAMRPLCCIRCIACVAYNNLETVCSCRPMQTDLKVGFQAAVCNTTDATHAGQQHR